MGDKRNRQQQQQPTDTSEQTTPTAAAAPILVVDEEPSNRFLAHLPINRVQFRDNVRNPDRPWNDGTVSQTLANAIIELGETRSYIPGARIVVKTLPNGGGRRFDLQLPSSGQAFKHPMIEVSEDEGAKLDFEEWKKLVVGAWMEYRKRRIAAGASTIKGLTPTLGVAADDAMLSDLGVMIDPAKVEPKAPEQPKA